MDILAARKKAAERAKPDRSAEKPQTAAASGPDAAAPVAARPELDRKTTAEPATPAYPEPVVAESVTQASHLDEAAPVQAPVVEQVQEMLSVLLGNEEYAIPVERVREVLTPREITPVPHTPPHILGVCSLRGAVLPIIDLKQRIGLANTGMQEKSRIVVVGIDIDDLIGMLVDQVRGVIRFPSSDVRPVPETLEQGEEFLTGIVRKDERLIILLDVIKAAASPV